VLTLLFSLSVAGTDLRFATTMLNLTRYVAKTLHSKKKLHRSTGAIAGLAGAVSVIIGMLAAYVTPKGWGRVTMALHVTKKPFIVKLAPIVTGVSVTIAAAAGLLGFFVWWMEGKYEAPEDKAERDS
jgi:hypothetical protein